MAQGSSRATEGCATAALSHDSQPGPPTRTVTNNPSRTELLYSTVLPTHPRSTTQQLSTLKRNRAYRAKARLISYAHWLLVGCSFHSPDYSHRHLSCLPAGTSSARAACWIPSAMSLANPCCSILCSCGVPLARGDQTAQRLSPTLREEVLVGRTGVGSLHSKRSEALRVRDHTLPRRKDLKRLKRSSGSALVKVSAGMSSVGLKSTETMCR